MLFCNLEIEVSQSINRHDCVAQGEKSLLEIEERGPLRCMAARIMFTFSIFGNCNSMCKYGVSACNDPYTCVYLRSYMRKYVSITDVSPAWTASIGLNRFSRSSLSVSPALYTRLKPLRCPTSTRSVIIRCNRTSQSRLVRTIS